MTDKFSEKIEVEADSEVLKSRAGLGNKKEEEYSPDELDIFKEEEGFLPQEARDLILLREHIDIFPDQLDPVLDLELIHQALKDIRTEKQSQERKKFMEAFKERYRIQKIGIAKMQLDLEKAIKQNPDIGESQLTELATSQKEKYNLTEKQIEFFREGIQNYITIRQGMNKLRTALEGEFGDKWAIAFMHRALGVSIKPLRFEPLPSCWYFSLSNEDFKKISDQNPNLGLQAETHGFYLLKPLFSQMPGVYERFGVGKWFIIPFACENDGLVSFGPWLDLSTKLHEEEHSIHKIYPPQTFMHQETKTLNAVASGLNQENVESEIYKLAIAYLTSFKNQAKTEILAFLKGGTSISGIRSSLTSEGGAYDFYRNLDISKSFTDEFKMHLDEMKKDNPKISKSLLDKYAGYAVYAIARAWQDHYIAALNRAFKAIEEWLAVNQENKEAKALLIKLLTTEPIDRWPRLLKIVGNEEQN